MTAGAPPPRPGPRVAVVHRHLAVAQALTLQVRGVLGDAGRLVVATTAQASLEPDLPDLVLLDEHLIGTSAGTLPDGGRPCRVVLLLESREGCLGGGRRWHLPMDSTSAELATVLWAALAGTEQPRLGCCDEAAALAGRQDRRAPTPASLTAREREVLACLSSGMHSKDIAEQLFVSVNTVRTHRRRILAKLGVHSALEAASVAREAIRTGRSR